MALLDEQDGDLVSFWKSISSVTAVVGSGSSAKIWPDEAKQGQDPPFIVFTAAGGQSHMHTQGISGLRETSVHVYCYAATRSAANSLAESVKVNTQTLQSQSIGGTWIDSVSGVVVDHGHETLEGTRKRYWTRLVLTIMHAEATAA